MPNDVFVGRVDEIKLLQSYFKKNTASLIVIKGRRRVGKSRLVEEFAKNSFFLKFSGLAPVEKITAQNQRDEFALQLSEQTGLPNISVDDWSQLFLLLAREVNTKKTVILLDEISWMAADDATFLSKLKNAWDDHLKKNSHLILVLCSSISTWIEENIINSTAFFGRISWTLTLDPLNLWECNNMLEGQGFKSSDYEKFKVLSVTGGIPWYIEQIQAQYSADDNIKRQCFTSGGILVDDFDRIFHELFEKRDTLYKKIILAMLEGPVSYDQISTQLQYPKSGRLTEYLDHLIQADFVKKDFSWSLKTGKKSLLHRYRISDNYIRFYLKYIEPKKEKIEAKKIEKINMAQLPAWETIFGLQFENLVINNRHQLYTLLNIAPESIVYDNPFFQHATTRQKGCQIDFLIQTQFNTVYLFEIKFSKQVLKKQVIEEVKEKIKRISLPRGMAVFPVLIHVNGVADSIVEENYFYAIIEFGQFLHQ